MTCDCPCHEQGTPVWGGCSVCHEKHEPQKKANLLVPINTSNDWIVDVLEVTDNRGNRVNKKFIFPPARWSVDSYGPEQAGFVYKLVQRVIPAENGITRLSFERYDEQKDADTAARIASDPGIR